MQNQLNTAPSASAEIMNQQFDGNSVFPRGEKNEAYAKYFTGDSYLTMLSMEGVVIGNGFDEWSINELRRQNIWCYSVKSVDESIVLERVS